MPYMRSCTPFIQLKNITLTKRYKTFVSVVAENFCTFDHSQCVKQSMHRAGILHSAEEHQL